MVMRFALSGAALGAVLLLMEATAIIGINYRALLGLPPNFARWHLANHKFDPELGFVYEPMRDSRVPSRAPWRHTWCLENPQYPIDVRGDRHGFRNAADVHIADVAVLGDSFIEADETPHERTVTTVLGHLLDRPVANLGRIAYGPQQELGVLKRYAIPLRPRVIVWTFYEGNDLLVTGARDGPATSPVRTSHTST
jgi:hypothetical protein